MARAPSLAWSTAIYFYMSPLPALCGKASRDAMCRKYLRNTTRSRRKNLATVASSSESWYPRASGNDEDLSWPRVAQPGAIPSPYEILRHRPGDEYNKINFYKLVKIYHPDMSQNGNGAQELSSVPEQVRMERYRLIVTAHEILSDPVKRKAFDNTGAGWKAYKESDFPGQRHSWAGSARSKGFDPDDSPRANASWQDWEEWYQRQQAYRSGTETTAEQSRNGSFLSFVAAVVLLGTFGHSISFDYHKVLREQVNRNNEEAYSLLHQRRAESCDSTNKDGRIHQFLRSRDTTNPDSLDKPSSEIEQKLLPPPPTTGVDHHNTHEHGFKNRQRPKQ